MNRLFTLHDLAETYRLPQHAQDELVAAVAPAEKTDDGEPLFLESQVDAWIAFRYSAARSSGGSAERHRPAARQADGRCAYLTVAEAQQRYLGEQMSRKWWYRIVQSGQIAHHRVGDSILLRSDDIEQFVAKSRKLEVVETPPPDPVPPKPVVPTPIKRATRRQREEVGFRFFPRSR